MEYKKKYKKYKEKYLKEIRNTENYKKIKNHEIEKEEIKNQERKKEEKRKEKKEKKEEKKEKKEKKEKVKKNKKEYKYIDIREIKIVKNVNKNELLKKVYNKEKKIEEYYEISNKFTSENSKILEIDIKKLKMKMETKDKRKYIIDIIPIYSTNLDEEIMCWSWNGNNFMNVDEVWEATQELKEKTEKEIKKIEHLDFDCVYNLSKELEKEDIIISDGMMVMNYLLKGKGYIKMTKLKDEYQYFDSMEIYIIRKIEEIKK